MKKKYQLKITKEEALDLSNFSDQTFYPLTGFMRESDYRKVVEEMHLNSGQAWTIPITLACPEDKISEIKKQDVIELVDSKNVVLADLEVEDFFKVDLENDLQKIFGTTEDKHPGVLKESQRSLYRIGGKVEIKNLKRLKPQETFYLSPEKTKKIFKELGWKTITGFQTRNPIHRAHEYLQRVAMEIADGIFLQPLVGWKKTGDITPESVFAAYNCMVKNFYPANRAVLGCLRTNMRYAGPREAVFHAILRRNYGCTHFIVGRDHAGIGGYYGKYAAHKFCHKFNDLGIKILTLCGPYYCQKCESIVTEKTCPHGNEYEISVSGSEVRAMMSQGKHPPKEFMRQEIADILIQKHREGNLFIEE